MNAKIKVGMWIVGLAGMAVVSIAVLIYMRPIQLDRAVEVAVSDSGF
jgi:hypothetical protein